MEPLWRPHPDQVSHSNVAGFMKFALERFDVRLGDYWELDRWAVEHPEKFWTLVWEFGNVIAETRGETVLEQGERMPGAKWFPQARLNFAENLLRRRDETLALAFWGEDKVKRHVSHREL